MGALTLLRKYQLISNLGNYERDENKKLKVIVTSMDTSFDEKGIYKWTFHDCYILSVSQMTFDYDSPNTAKLNVTFNYSYFDEE